MSRRDIRETAVKILYNYSITGDLLMPDKLDGDLFGINKLNANEYSYLEKLLHDFKNNQIQIDELISNNLFGWKLERVSKVDLSILRLAFSEIKYEDTPPKVVINEALDIAKVYSGEKSHKFINGVLAGFLKQMENNEYAVKNATLP